MVGAFIPDDRYAGIADDELLRFSDDQFLADVDVTLATRPPAPRRSTDDEWYAEAASLPHMGEAFSGFVLARAQAAAADETQRTQTAALLEAVPRLTRTGSTIAQAATSLGVSTRAAARALTTSDEFVDRTLEIERLLREHMDWSYRRTAATVEGGCAVGTVIRLAEMLGLERKSINGPRNVSAATCERVRTMVEQSQGTPKWASIGREVGMHRSHVRRLAVRRGWIAA